MGGSSSKRTFFWQKKKKSPVNKAWSQLKGALPNKKRKKSKKNILSLDKLKGGKHSKKRFSLSTDKKQPTSQKRLSLGNTRKESTGSLGRKHKDGGGLAKVGEQIKRKFSVPASQPHQATPASVDLKYKREENELDNGAKVSKKRLSDIMKSIHP